MNFPLVDAGKGILSRYFLVLIGEKKNIFHITLNLRSALKHVFEIAQSIVSRSIFYVILNLTGKVLFKNHGSLINTQLGIGQTKKILGFSCPVQYNQFTALSSL